VQAITSKRIPDVAVREGELVGMNKIQERPTQKRVGVFSDALGQRRVDVKKRQVAGENGPVCVSSEHPILPRASRRRVLTATCVSDRVSWRF
jgi:hypothetical protein